MWLIWIIVISIILWYFLAKKDSDSRKQENNQNFSIDSIIDGYEFNATLDPNTPLIALQHHRKIRNGPKNELPVYGDLRDGIWLEYFEDHNTLPSSEEISDLNFLTKFREIYESNSSLSEKEKTIATLIKDARGSRQAENASKWYLWDLIEVPGISKSIAEVLYAEGIKTKNDVKNTSDEKLLNVPGIGPGRLKQIRTFFETS